MEIIRIPKGRKDASVARLVLLKSSNGRIQATLQIQGPMSGLMTQDEYEAVKLGFVDKG